MTRHDEAYLSRRVRAGTTVQYRWAIEAPRGKAERTARYPPATAGSPAPSAPRPQRYPAGLVRARKTISSSATEGDPTQFARRPLRPVAGRTG